LAAPVPGRETVPRKAAHVPGHAPKRLVIVLDDGQEIVLPVGPWFARWDARRRGVADEGAPARASMRVADHAG